MEVGPAGIEHSDLQFRLLVDAQHHHKSAFEAERMTAATSKYLRPLGWTTGFLLSPRSSVGQGEYHKELGNSRDEQEKGYLRNYQWSSYPGLYLVSSLVPISQRGAR